MDHEEPLSLSSGPTLQPHRIILLLQRRDRSLNGSALLDSSPDSDEPDAPVQGRFVGLFLKGLEDPLAELHSSSQQSIHREMHVGQTAFHTESRQTRKCLTAGPQHDLLIAPATCNRPSPSLRQDQYRPCESECRSVVDCRRAALASPNRSPESSLGRR